MQTSKKLVLGIDGGGTKTEWLFLEHREDLNANLILAKGRLPASNIKITSDESLIRLFETLPGGATHVGAFLAGCGTDSDREHLRALVARVWPHAHIEVGSDRNSAFATAFGDGDGIAVIAGTGSAVHGRRGAQYERAGGWGQLLGDRGGGYDLAMQGLRCTLCAFDLEHHVTPLGRDALRELALNSLEDLVDWARNADKMSVAKLAPIVFRAADDGDAEALDIVNAGARRLAQYACAVAKRLEVPTPEVKLLGGLFIHHPVYVDLFKGYLADLVSGARVAVCADSPAIGAARLAAGEAVKVRGRAEPRAVIQATELSEIAGASTEQRNPRSEHLDEMDTGRLIDLFVSEEDRVTDALAAASPSLEEAVKHTSESLNCGGRLFYVGAGTSGRLGMLDASEIPPTFGAPIDLVQGIIAGGVQALYRAVEGAEDEALQGAVAIAERGLRGGDVVCGITASGRTPFVFGALERAKSMGAVTILLTCNPSRQRNGKRWDVEIDLPTGPELVTGSTRLKAGTATKVALNILSTCTMIRLGKVKGNLMVDLRASNVKLRDRAIRVVSETRQLSYQEAEQILLEHDWNVRESLAS
jgi:N-acetylmuramic acid 6-phosphate etherase